MKISSIGLGIAATLCLAGMAKAGSRGDWPRWGGANNCNMVSSVKGIPDTLPEKPLWEVEIGAYVTTPAIAEGVVVIGGEKGVWCLDAATGECRWWFPTLRKGWGGVCATAAIEGGRIYELLADGMLLCFDVDGMKDGNDGPFTDEQSFARSMKKRPDTVPKDAHADVIWMYDITKETPSYIDAANSSSPLLVNGLIYMGTANAVGARWDIPDAKGHDFSHYPEAPSLIALDQKTGRVVAQDMEKIGRRMLHGQWSSPSMGEVGGRKLVFYGGGDGLCYAFEALGADLPFQSMRSLKKVWAFDCNPPEYRFDEKGNRIASSKWNLCSKKYNGNRVKGHGSSEIVGTPVFHEGSVYVALGDEHGGAGGVLWRLDAATGKAIWVFKGMRKGTKKEQRIRRTLSTVSVVNGLVFMMDGGGYVSCFDADTGEMYWNHFTGKNGQWDSTMAIDGKVYYNTRVFACDKEKKALAEDFPGTPYPYAEGGIFVVRRKKSLCAYRLENSSDGKVAFEPEAR